MIRKKEIVLVSHCVLNQNSVINDWERARGGFNTVIKKLLDKDIGIIQLPCPEFKFLGSQRPPKGKAQYDTFQYRSLCSELSKDVVTTIREYIDNDYTLVGLIGIAGSPTCDSTHAKGIFMEELLGCFKASYISIPCMDIPENYVEGLSQIELNFDD